MYGYCVYIRKSAKTVTNVGADRLNSIVLNALFKEDTPIAYVRLDTEHEHRNLYQNMRLVITENGIVNVQIYSLLRREGKSLFVR